MGKGSFEIIIKKMKGSKNSFFFFVVIEEINLQKKKR